MIQFLARSGAVLSPNSAALVVNFLRDDDPLIETRRADDGYLLRALSVVSSASSGASRPTEDLPFPDAFGAPPFHALADTFVSKPNSEKSSHWSIENRRIATDRTGERELVARFSRRGAYSAVLCLP